MRHDNKRPGVFPVTLKLKDMRANEINWNEKVSYYFSANEYKGRYKFIMGMGRCFPITKAQAKYFVKEGICLDVLNNMDVEKIEKVLNDAGFVGEYKFSKSKTWVRLQNNSDLHKAIKVKFGF